MKVYVRTLSLKVIDEGPSGIHSNQKKKENYFSRSCGDQDPCCTWMMASSSLILVVEIVDCGH